MEKAYDFKGLLDNLKNQGVEIAEESAKVLVVALFDWLEQSADMSENKYDDLLKALYPLAKAEALKAAENINKADNQ